MPSVGCEVSNWTGAAGARAESPLLRVAPVAVVTTAKASSGCLAAAARVMKSAIDGWAWRVLAETSATNTVAWRSTTWGRLMPIRASSEQGGDDHAQREREVGAQRASGELPPGQRSLDAEQYQADDDERLPELLRRFDGLIARWCRGSARVAARNQFRLVGATKLAANDALDWRPAASCWMT